MKENIVSNKYQLSLLFLTKKSNYAIVSSKKIINTNVNVICYDSKDIVPTCLRSISQKYYSTHLPLHVPTEEYNNIMDKNNRIESIEFEISVSIGMQYTTYDYNDEFWYYI